jgi:hypothetical protein
MHHGEEAMLFSSAVVSANQTWMIPRHSSSLIDVHLSIVLPNLLDVNRRDMWDVFVAHDYG